MAEELKYTSGYDGATTDDLLGYAQEAKEVGVNAYVKESKELKSNEYVRSMKEQLPAEDAETVQVYDVEGVPHKISKKELISKAGIQLPSLEEIGGFVAYDTNGQALGLMSKEQVAQVVGGLIGEATQDKDGLMSKEYTIYNEAEVTGLNFNILRNLFRLYCSYGGTNSPVAGSYYWGIVNIGWNYGHFVQLACRTLDDGNSAIYARAYNEPRFTPWKEIISFTM